MVRVISFAYASIIFLLVILSLVETLVYTKCELFGELTKKHGLVDEEAAKWTCIGNGISDLNSTFIIGDLQYGILGIFGIQAVFWCASDVDGQLCGVPCEKFIDDDITDDLKCAREFILKDYGGSFDTWYKYRESRCELKWEEIVNECKSNKSLIDNTTEATSTTSTQRTETSVRTVEIVDHVQSSTATEPTVSSSTADSITSTTTSIKSEVVTPPVQLNILDLLNNITVKPIYSETTKMPDVTSSQLEIITSTTSTEASISSENPKMLETSTISVPISTVVETLKTTEATKLPIIIETTTQTSINMNLPSLIISDLRSVIDNPCKYAERLQLLYNLTKDDTITWTCMTMNGINCYNNGLGTCILSCNSTFGKHCDELSRIVDTLAKELSEKRGSTINRGINFKDCQDHIGPFIENWCHLSVGPSVVTERFDVPQISSTTGLPILVNEDVNKTVSSSLQIDDKKVTESKNMTTEKVSNTTELTDALSTTHATPSSSSSSETSITSETSTLPSQSENTTRGTLTLNHATILADPCAAILLIAQNYNMNKWEASTWLCIMRDLTFCHYNCAVNCNTALRYGLNNANYCEELSLTIEGVFNAAKDALIPLFSLIPFNNCQAEIFPFAVNLCPQLSSIRD